MRSFNMLCVLSCLKPKASNSRIWTSEYSDFRSCPMSTPQTRIHARAPLLQTQCSLCAREAVREDREEDDNFNDVLGAFAKSTQGAGVGFAFTSPTQSQTHTQTHILDPTNLFQSEHQEFDERA